MLDNPIWNALRTRHAHLAIGHGKAMRYPPAATPFVAVENKDAQTGLSKIVAPGERVGILSVIPEMTDHWELAKEITIFQYVWPDEAEPKPDPEVVRLGPDEIPAMLELTALVYPAYFRTETANLGDYFGIVRNGRLCAMAGIRMSMDGYQELSAICTHPESRGQGLAARLTSHVTHHVLSGGDRAFLHTEFDNHPAQALYEKLGFRLRSQLPFQLRVRKPIES